jgi:predicted MFS family arabinose efflux permease
MLRQGNRMEPGKKVTTSASTIQEKGAESPRFWTPNIILLAITVFSVSLGQGLAGGVGTNFLVHGLGLDGQQILWLSGIREIPGLLLVFLAVLLVRLPLSRQAGLSLVLMAVGYGCYSLVRSYTSLIAVALVASMGFHTWAPVSSALAMKLVDREQSGRILGRMRSVTALAGAVGMGVVIVLSDRLGLRPFYTMSGVALALGAVLVLRLPSNIGSTLTRTTRMVFKRRYWIYYVLVFFEGSRTQVFFTFGTWVLVQFHQVSAAQLSMLMLTNRLVSFAVAPRVGDLIDRLGERSVLSVSYVGLAAGFVGYAVFHNVWLLALMYILINLLLMSRIALDTYVNRIASSEELAPTLSTGVSLNHITSVGMSLVAGILVNSLGYEVLCLAAAVMILASVPFALALGTEPQTCVDGMRRGPRLGSDSAA